MRKISTPQIIEIINKIFNTYMQNLIEGHISSVAYRLYVTQIIYKFFSVFINKREECLM